LTEEAGGEAQSFRRKGRNEWLSCLLI
jgi:hypothetical protein